MPGADSCRAGESQTSVVVSFFVSKHSAKAVQLASGAIRGSINWAALGGDPLGELQILAGMATPQVLQQRLPAPAAGSPGAVNPARPLR